MGARRREDGRLAILRTSWRSGSNRRLHCGGSASDKRAELCDAERFVSERCGAAGSGTRSEPCGSCRESGSPASDAARLGGTVSPDAVVRSPAPSSRCLDDDDAASSRCLGDDAASSWHGASRRWRDAGCAFAAYGTDARLPPVVELGERSKAVMPCRSSGGSRRYFLEVLCFLLLTSMSRFWQFFLDVNPFVKLAKPASTTSEVFLAVCCLASNSSTVLRRTASIARLFSALVLGSCKQ